MPINEPVDAVPLWALFLAILLQQALIDLRQSMK
jgi:hypothetical protein